MQELPSELSILLKQLKNLDGDEEEVEIRLGDAEFDTILKIFTQEDIKNFQSKGTDEERIQFLQDEGISEESIKNKKSEFKNTKKPDTSPTEENPNPTTKESTHEKQPENKSPAEENNQKKQKTANQESTQPTP